MFRKIEVLTAAEMTALKIKQEIVKGNLSKGTKLPSERELSEKLGVGRSTIREALQILKILGLITVKGGGKGGAFVKETNISSVTNIIELMMELDLSNWKEVIEVRMAVEPFTNKLAAINRSEEDLDILWNIMESSKSAFNNYEEYASYNTKFHLKLAECSHNKLLLSLVNAIGILISKSGHELVTEQTDFEMVYYDHMKIYDAIRKKDAELTFKLSEQHLRFAAEEYMKKYNNK